MTDTEMIDEAGWRRVASSLIRRAFLLAGQGELTPPITITIDDEEATIFQLSLPDLTGAVEYGPDCPARIEPEVRYPLHVEITDGSIAYRLEVKQDAVVIQ